MKKLLTYILSLYFLAISLLPNSGVVELFKAGNLVKHFTHHQVEHQENINFIEFLVLHYLDREHQKKDAHEHTDLPFQQHGNQAFVSNINFIFLTPYTFSWDFKLHNESQNAATQAITYQENSLSSFPYSVWQPPKFI
jgi:hypothetical protein